MFGPGEVSWFVHDAMCGIADAEQSRRVHDIDNALLSKPVPGPRELIHIAWGTVRAGSKASQKRFDSLSQPLSSPPVELIVANWATLTKVITFEKMILGDGCVGMRQALAGPRPVRPSRSSARGRVERDHFACSCRMMK
jgi:hypothetical protein